MMAKKQYSQEEQMVMLELRARGAMRIGEVLSLTPGNIQERSLTISKPYKRSPSRAWFPSPASITVLLLCLQIEVTSSGYDPVGVDEIQPVMQAIDDAGARILLLFDCKFSRKCTENPASNISPGGRTSMI